MKYKLKFSKQAAADLGETFDYISLTLKAKTAAKNLMCKMDKAINTLREFPESCPLCSDDTLHEMNYRRLVVDNFVVIYLVDKKAAAVFIVRIFYGGRDYTKYIK